MHCQCQKTASRRTTTAYQCARAEECQRAPPLQIPHFYNWNITVLHVHCVVSMGMCVYWVKVAGNGWELKWKCCVSRSLTRMLRWSWWKIVGSYHGADRLSRAWGYVCMHPSFDVLNGNMLDLLQISFHCGRDAMLLSLSLTLYYSCFRSLQTYMVLF